MDYTPVIEAFRKLADAFEQLQLEQQGKNIKKKRKGRGWSSEQKKAQSEKQKTRWANIRAAKPASANQQIRRTIKPLGGMNIPTPKRPPAKPIDPHEFLKPDLPIKYVDADDPTVKR